jgi:hypothetical protein
VSRTIFLILSTILFANLKGQDGETLVIDSSVHIYNPLDSIVFDSIVCYNFDIDSTGKEIIKNNVIVKENVFRTKTLNRAQIDTLTTLLTDYSIFSRRKIGCCVTTILFAFYKNGIIGESLFACPSCGGIGASFNIPAKQYYFERGDLNYNGQVRFEKLLLSLNMTVN